MSHVPRSPGVSHAGTVDDLERPEPQSSRHPRAAHLRFDHAGRHQGELRGSPRTSARRCRSISRTTRRTRRSRPVGARSADAIIINPAAYSFTSIAIIDALKTFEGPIIELHVSNIHARDELHRHSKISGSVKAVICGLGPYGYIVAMQAALQILGKLPPDLAAPLRDGPR